MEPTESPSFDLVREILECKIQALVDRVDIQFQLVSSCQKEMAQEQLLALQAHIDKATEQFRAIDIRLAERDLRRIQQKEASELAIAKSEISTAKQIDSIQALIQNSVEALSDKIIALTTRMDRGEGRSSGLNAGWGYLIGAIGLAATVISIAYSLR